MGKNLLHIDWYLCWTVSAPEPYCLRPASSFQVPTPTQPANCSVCRRTIPMRLNGQQRHFPSAGSMNSGYAMGGSPRPQRLQGSPGLGEEPLRAISLVLLSIAIMALLLTDADAKRRSSAQGSQAAGASGSWCATYPAQGLNDNCSYSSFNQCYQTVLGLGGFCRPNTFPGTAYGTGHSWSSGPPR